MKEITLDGLAENMSYAGEGISVRLLEETVSQERSRQNDQVEAFTMIRSRNMEIQKSLGEEMGKLRELVKTLHQSRGEKSFLRQLVEKLSWFKDEKLGEHSIEALLRQQYEITALRLKQAAEYADRLEASKEDLYNEIERLNNRIVESAENEDSAAQYVSQLRALKQQMEERLGAIEFASPEHRRLQSHFDRTRRLLAEHTTRLRLYSTAEERLAKLKRNTWQLAETISNLQGDITRYVTAASEKLDLIAGQIQAIGAAADASLVMMELKRSLDTMTESVNYTARFVAETQAYFRENVDRMVDNLKLYDQETEQVLAEKLIYNEALTDLEIEDALSVVQARQPDSEQ